MKKIIIFFPIIIIVMLSACSVQQKMNPMVFVERFSKSFPEYSFSVNNLMFDNNTCFGFLENENITFAVKFYTDNKMNIKKICLASKTDKTELFNRTVQSVIKTYAPDEDEIKITSELFDDKSDYHTTQWYRYSSVKDNGYLYFSTENMKISTETDAQPTLKAEDITYP